jgi:hypothetical protein
VFTDRRGQHIGDVELTGVDVGVDEDDAMIPGVNAIPGVDANEIPGVNDEGHDPTQQLVGDHDTTDVEIDLDIETVDTAAPEGPRVDVDTSDTASHTQPDEGPDKVTGVRRSIQVKLPKQDYIPSMTVSKYAYAVTQMECQGTLNPDAHMFLQEDMYQAEPDVVAMVMTQLSLKGGLKYWGDKGKTAVRSKIKQLHFRDTFKLLHWHQMTRTQKQSVLESHMFLKEKRDGTIKGRVVAGNNKQRDYISKEDASSPTVATESVLLTCIVDAEEEREVAVINIPNAFIQTRIEDKKDMVIIKIRGVLVDMLLDIAPAFYNPCATMNKKGTKQLLVQC